MSQHEHRGNDDHGHRPSGLTDMELDREIIARLAVRRAEHRIGRVTRPGLTADELALDTDEPLPRVETRLRELASVDRISGPTGELREWTPRRRE
jgi:hypothetical protein